MSAKYVSLPCALVLASSLLLAGPMGYLQTNLVSNGAVPAAVTDANLVNPWGISFGPTSPFWIADNGTGLSTLYRGDGSIVPLVVTVPGAPTGTVFNGGAGFLADRFLFASEDGTISGWKGALGTTAAVRAGSTTSGAVYKGLAIDAGRIFATDFAGGKIDAWDSSYGSLSLPFIDPTLPVGFAPFGIQNVGGLLYVTYAKKKSGSNDDESGPGNGFVDIFDSNGVFQMRLISNGALNSPWGVALAPSGFGDFGGDLLIGNFGDGRINAFNPSTGAFLGALADGAGSPIFIDGLWGLAFGNGGPGFDSGKLYFTAGLNEEADGLFGSLTAIPEPATAMLLAAGLASLALLRRRT